MWSSGGIIQFFRCAGLLIFLGAAPAFAQQSQQPARQGAPTQKTYWDCISPVCTYVPGDKTQRPYGGGTPLDVILNTRLWTEVPEAPDFVKQSRPPEGTLQYQTTGGKDIPRPRLKTSAELQDMEEELDRAGAAADRAAGVKSHFHVEAKKKTKLNAARKPPASSAMQKPLDLSATAKTSQQ
jgi:hypothetical protein